MNRFEKPTFISLLIRRSVGNVSSLSSGARNKKKTVILWFTKKNHTKKKNENGNWGGQLTDYFPEMFGLNEEMERQPAVGQGVWQKTVFQKISVLHIRGRRDSLVGLQVLKQAHCLINKIEKSVSETHPKGSYGLIRTKVNLWCHLTEGEGGNVLICCLYDL